MEVVVGTYEELILSYKLACEEIGHHKLVPAFTDHSHSGSLRSVAISRTGILASGGTDEIIRLFDLRKRHEQGMLVHHEGTVTSLSFFGRKHMFSGSEDGTVGVWRTGQWECVRTFRKHKGPVHCVSVHPSGKLALSVGKDKSLCAWNLVVGKNAYMKNIKEVADFVVWSPSGDWYIIVINNKVDIYTTETAEVVYSIRYAGGRISAAVFIKSDILAVSGDGGKVELYSLAGKARVYDFSTRTNRVKGLGCCKCTAEDNAVWLASGSSDGLLKVWLLRTPTSKSDRWSSTLQSEVDTKFRITCLALLPDKGSSTADGERQAQSEEAITDQEDRVEEEEDPAAEAAPSHKVAKGKKRSLSPQQRSATVEKKKFSQKQKISSKKKRRKYHMN